jgi:GntR family transcriptional regulator, transcriptional repressor for pyruvate dehydrogenase complex
MSQTPLASQRLYEQMAQRIRNQIVAGELTAGDKLPNERTLAEQFGVSRTVVREAIKTLKQEGLVEVQAGLGTFIVDDTGAAFTQSFGLLLSVGNKKTHLLDIVEIREILEPEIAAMAAVHASPDDIEALERALMLMDAHMEDISKYAKEDHSFHLVLAHASGNAILPYLMASIVDLLQELRERIALVQGARERGQAHHRLILKAIKQQDAAAARAAMQDHLRQVRQDSGTENATKEKPND